MSDADDHLIDPSEESQSESEFVIPVPDDDDLDGYLLPNGFGDTSVEQSFEFPQLPSREEVERILERGLSAIQKNGNGPTEQRNAFDSVVRLLSQIDRKYFEQPCFGQSPFERLNEAESAATRIANELSAAQRLLQRICSKNVELVTNAFYQVAFFHLARSVTIVGNTLSIVVLNEQLPTDTLKVSSQICEDCSLAADQLIRCAGFRPAMPQLELPETTYDDEGNPVPLEDTAEGNQYIGRQQSRKAYTMRRDAEDVPTINLGEVGQNIERHHVEMAAGSLQQVAVAEFRCMRAYQFELASSLSLAQARATELQIRVRPYDQLVEIADDLAAKLQSNGTWNDLTGQSHRAFIRLRGTKIQATRRVISDASVAAAKAKLDRAEKIRFKVAELLTRNEHPAIKYVEDLIAKEKAAYTIAIDLFDSGEFEPKLDESVRLSFQIEPPTFDAEMATLEDDDESLRLSPEDDQ